MGSQTGDAGGWCVLVSLNGQKRRVRLHTCWSVHRGAVLKDPGVSVKLSDWCFLPGQVGQGRVPFSLVEMTGGLEVT